MKTQDNGERGENRPKSTAVFTLDGLFFLFKQGIIKMTAALGVGNE